MSVEELFSTLNERTARYAVLRWFDNLPAMDDGEDLDLLVHDDDAPLLEQVLTRSSRLGNVLCDVYSVTGLHGTEWRGTPYYPPHLAETLLSRAQKHPSGAFVPCPDDHFHSLAFHALYHKGYASGLPARKGLPPQCADPEHDYAASLRRLAEERGEVVEMTMEALDARLAATGWRPPLDTLVKWSSRNRWISDLIDGLPSTAEAPPGLTVLLVRQRAAGHVHELERIATAHGFIHISTVTLTSSEVDIGIQHLRGGNWGKGPYPTSGGTPHTLLVLVDPRPIRPTPRETTAHPGLDNARLISLKERARSWWNAQQPQSEHCNILHSSDSANLAGHYLSVLVPQRCSELLAAAERRLPNSSGSQANLA